MANPGLSDELAQQTADAFRLHGTKRGAAEAMGINEATFKNRLHVARCRGMLNPHEVIEPAIREAALAGGIEDPSTLSHFWKITKDDQGNGYSLFVKNPESGETVSVTDIIKQAFEEWEPPAWEAGDAPSTDADLLTIYPLADMHLGLKAVADESGADFDLDIATERFRNVTGRLFDRSPNSDTALILQLGDFSHVDDDLALTPSSKNSLQVSDRLLDIARAGLQIMIDYIHHALRKHRRVIVKVLKGNHDLNAWMSLYIGLSQRFRDDDRVTIDGGAADYWFFRFGTTLIGAHHGHRLKPEQMAGAMAMECREDWGETLYRLFLHGHLHHRRVIEVMGVSVECMRTIAEVDQFHSGKYGSGKSLTSITIHKVNGEDGRQQINIPPTKKRAFQDGIR